MLSGLFGEGGDGMSVLIRGTEMPERCGQCFLRVGKCKQRIYMEQRPKNCPLVEIPPHGRLIDADDSMKHLADDGREAFTKHQVWMFFSEYGAPTILEAEE